MAEGVTEIEQRPRAALFALVGRHDLGLGADAGLHRMAALLARRGKHLAPILLEPGEERRIVDEPVFHHLRIARAELALAQGRERGNVGQHQARLVESADQILALPRVDAGLAADRGIHLGQQRGRHLHDADAAPQNAGGKARQIADHPAAERHDAIAALDAKLEQALAERRQYGEALARLAGAHHGLAEKQAVSVETRFHRGEIERRHVAVADHHAARARKRGGDPPPGRGNQPLADDDRVAPSRQLYFDDCLALA
jgi:hypothetical protein